MKKNFQWLILSVLHSHQLLLFTLIVRHCIPRHLPMHIMRHSGISGDIKRGKFTSKSCFEDIYHRICHVQVNGFLPVFMIYANVQLCSATLQGMNQGGIIFPTWFFGQQMTSFKHSLNVKKTINASNHRSISCIIDTSDFVKISYKWLEALWRNRTH